MLKNIANTSDKAAEAQRRYREAELTARKAVALAPRSPRAYSVLGDILHEQLKPRAALAEYRKMLALNVDNAAAYMGYAIFLGEMKHTDEALGLINRSASIDPLNPNNYSWKAHILLSGRRFEAAIESQREVLRLAPDRTQPKFRIAFNLTLLGRYEEAAKAMQGLEPRSPIEQVYRAVLAAKIGKIAEAEAILEQFRTSDFANFQVAEVLAQLGRKDEAIAALERAWRARDSGLTTLLVDPLLDPLRDDPRFDAIVKRIDFPA
jgi:tetratricopeptide (TPR) repeat protein